MTENAIASENGAVSPSLMPATAMADAHGGQGNAPAHVTERMMADLALANRIANDNPMIQNAIQHQQAMAQLQIAAVGKCIEMMFSIDAAQPSAAEQIKLYMDMIDAFMEKFGRISPAVDSKALSA